MSRLVARVGGAHRGQATDPLTACVVALCLIVAGSPAWAGADPVFVEVASSAGIDFAHYYDDTFEVAHRRNFGSGAAAADYDNDGWVDLYIANGSGGANALYHNNGNGTFTDVAGSAGADLVMMDRESKCALFLDYDGDGLLDLLVANDGDPFDPATHEPPTTMQSQLFRNLGGGQFEDVTVSANIPSHEYRLFWGQDYGQVGAVAAGDLNGDGYPEIYISYWEDEDTLLRNNGDGTFTDITVASSIETLEKDNFTPLMWDFDGDGLLDIHVCVDDGTPNMLFINQGGLTLTFVDGAPAAGLDVAAWAEMGAALGDYDNDGDFDLYMTNIEAPVEAVGNPAESANKWNRFMRNDSTQGDMNFVDIGGDVVDDDGEVVQSNVTFVRTGWGWGVTFIDYDHDGWLDLAVVNGQQTGQPGSPGTYVTDQSEFYRNDGPDLDDPGGIPGWLFTDVSEAVGFNDDGIAKALMAFDYDRDGDLDLFVTRYLDDALLYENDGGAELGNWLVVDPIGTLPNMHAIGATVFLEAGGIEQMRFITAGTSYLAQEPDLAHFGVGTATTVDSVRIVWADGTEDVVTDLAVNQYVEIIQGVGLPPEPQGDAISLAISGPLFLVEQSTQAFVATAEFENGASADVTADATWTVIAGGQYAEFDDTNPGTLTTLVLDSLDQADVTIQADFESLSATYDVAVIDLSGDLAGPTLAITRLAMTNEKLTATVSGTADDDAGVVAVTWSSDHAGSGPCTGLVDWTTGPILLTEGVNLITITATDGLQNSASVDLSVTYTVPEPPIDAGPLVDPEPPLDPDSTDPDPNSDPLPEPADDAQDPEPGDDPTADDGDTDPVADGGGNDLLTPSTGLCGGMGMISLPVLLLGLCAIRRRSVL